MLRPALAVFILIALASAGCAAADDVPDLRARKTGSDWPTFLGPTGDGKSTETIRKDWGESGLPVVWFKKVGEGYSAPSVSKGRLFFFDRLEDEARLTAMNAETGEQLWQSTYPTRYEDYYNYSVGPRANPVVDGERVYAYGVEGRLRALHVVDGELLWELDTVERFGVVRNFFGVGSTPVVEGDLLIVQVGGSPAGSPEINKGEVEGDGTGIVAFDKMTGEVRYAITDELASYASPVMATIGDRRWGFMFTRGGLVGFEPGKGQVDFFYPWRAKKLESVNAASPVVFGNHVFITESYGPGSSLLEVEPGGYELVWKDPPRGKAFENHWSTPIYHEGYLYGSSGQSTGNALLRAVDPMTAEVKWSVPELTRATLTWADGHFLVLNEYGRLLLVKATPERYELVAEMDLGKGTEKENPKDAVDLEVKADRPMLRHPSWNPPVLSNGYLYLRGKDQLICLDISPSGAS